MVAIKRKYVLSKVTKGDYLLPSNDAKTVWRIRSYVDGPSSGIEDWPKDITVWGVWRWMGELPYVDVENVERWQMVSGPHMKQGEAIEEAMKLS